MSSSFKKIFVVAAASALLVTGLAGCNRSGSSASGSSSSSDKVLLALSTQTNPFFIQLRDGAKQEAAKLGVDLVVQDASNDSATQTNQLNNAATGGYNAVILNPTDSDALSPAVKELNTAKIPVITVDRSVTSGTVASFIASDNVKGGQMAADELAKSIDNQGSILVLQGTPGTSAARDRGAGFTQEIAKYPNIKIVGAQTANFDRATALDVTSNLMQAHPGVTAIFAQNDEMALGAVEALGSKAGSAVKVISFDGTPDGFKAVQQGKINVDIAQQPGLLGSTAVDQANKLFKGEQATATIPMPVVVVTKENVSKYL